MFMWRVRETIEKIVIFIAFRVPKSVAYWCAIRLASGDGTGKSYAGNPGERTCADMLKAHNSWVR